MPDASELSYDDDRVEQLIREFPRISTISATRLNGTKRTARAFGRKYLFKSDHEELLSHFPKIDGPEKEPLITDVESVLGFAIWRQGTDLSHEAGKSMLSEVDAMEALIILLGQVDAMVRQLNTMSEALGIAYINERWHRYGDEEILDYDLLNLSSHFKMFGQEVDLWRDAISSTNEQVSENFDDKQRFGEGGKAELWVRDSVFLLANVWKRYAKEKPTNTVDPYADGHKKYSRFARFCHDCLGIVSPKKPGVSFPQSAVLVVTKGRYAPSLEILEAAQNVN